MPPSMPNPAKRMTANPKRPARYRPGKAVQEDESSEEESEEEEEQSKQQQQLKQQQSQAYRSRAAVQQPEEEDEDDEEGFVTDDDDDGRSALTKKPPVQQKSTSTTSLQGSVVQAQQSTSTSYAVQGVGTSEEEGSESEEESDEDSEEESSEEEEAPQRKFQRPTFIKKTDRKTSNTPGPNNDITNDNNANPLAAASTPETSEIARRKAQAELLIKDKLERDLLARAAGRKAWDDDDEVDPLAMVDDTDGLDPEAEYQAWKLRELKRLKRDREAIEAREREIEETERRRNLTAAEREKEDREYIERQKEEKEESRGKANFLARYHHKGAFFQDDAMAEILKKRDIMGAKFVDDVGDKSTLPEYMRVRDMTKLGKKGRTRYTDLKGQDTGRFGDDVKKWRGAGDNRGREGLYPDSRGVDERFMPDRDRDGRDNNGPTGANASVVGVRKERRFNNERSRSRSRSRSKSPPSRRTMDNNRGGGAAAAPPAPAAPAADHRMDSYRPSRRRTSYSRSRSRSRSDSQSRSRSRSPPRRKRRSPSPYSDRDKRRRIEN